MRTRGRWFAIRNVALLGSVLVGAAMLAAPATAGLWEWTDGAGRPHKSRTRNDVPEEFRANAVEIQVEPSMPSAGSGADGAKPSERAPARSVPTAQPDASSLDQEITDRDGHDRDWWREQVIAARREINDLEAKLERLKAESRYNSVIRKEREARHEHAKVQAELTAARKRLAEDLPKQAAAAGAPAYWLRVQ